MRSRVRRRKAGSIARALARVTESKIDGAALVRWFANALISPVLTAHPTEVQRRSILDSEREIARLLQWRDRVEFTPEEVAEFEAGLYRQVLTLWQTAMLRLSKLQVTDEIENGLAFYRYTFLTEIPKIYSALEESLRRDFALGPGVQLSPFLRMGSWIGGDRDGNPNVVGQTLARAIGAQATVAFSYYLEQIHQLGAELSLSARLVTPSSELLALATAAHDANPHRKDEPYRQALVGIYSRVAATASALAGFVPPRAPQAQLAPYATPVELLADLRTIDRSLSGHGADFIAAGRLVPLMRAVEVFGFHLAALDLRQNADVHQAVVAELLARAGVVDNYDTLPEETRVALLTRELASARLLYSPHLEYSPRTATELGILNVAADIHRRFGAAALPNYVISKCQSVSDLLEVGDHAQGSRVTARDGPVAQHHSAVRDHR